MPVGMVREFSPSAQISMLSPKFEPLAWLFASSRNSRSIAVVADRAVRDRQRARVVREWRVVGDVLEVVSRPSTLGLFPCRLARCLSGSVVAVPTDSGNWSSGAGRVRFSTVASVGDAVSTASR
jgi:hypothetical protein